MIDRQNSRRMRQIRRLLPLLVAGALVSGCGDSPEQMLSSAKAFAEKKDYNAAVIQLKNALQEDGEMIEARYLLGKIYFERGEMANAIKEFQHAVRLGYGGEDITPMLARALVQQGQRDEVLKTYAGVALKDPKALSDLLTVLGDTRLAQDREAAQRDYLDALKANPANGLAKLGMARIHALAGRMDDALQTVDEVIQATPDNVQAYALKGQLLVSREDLDGGVAALRKAIDIEPKDQHNHYSMVLLLAQAGRLDEAKTGLNEMVKAAGKTSLSSYLEAYLAYRENKTTAARDAIQEVIRVAPDFLPAHLLGGAIFYRLNDQLQAQTNLNKVLEADPSNVMARRLLVLSYIAQRDSARAVDTLEPLLAASPDAPETLALAGQAYLLTGDFERSSEYFAKQVEKRPSDARAMTRLGISRLAAGEVEQGLTDLGTASGLDAELGYPDFARVTILLSEKKFDEALEAQAALEKKLPDNPLTHNLRGGIMMGKGDIPAAREAFRKALDVSPGFLPAATNLARLAFKDGKVDEARKIYQDMLDRDPKRADVHLSLAELEQAARGDSGTIRKHLEAAVEVAPQQTLPRVRLVEFLLRHKKQTEALAVAQDAQSAAPGNPAVLGAIGHALLANGDVGQAVISFQKRAELLPQSAIAFLDLGRAQDTAGNARAAVQALTHAKSLNPNLFDPYRLLVTINMKEKNFDEAERLAKELESRHPKSGLGYLFEGGALAARGEWKSALPAFQKAHQLSPNALTAVNLHTALVRVNRQGDADKLVKEWLSDHPSDVTMKAYLAERALANERYDEASALYVDILEKTPDSSAVLNNLAWVAGQRKDPKAIEYARRALALAPENPAILDTAGMIEVGQGEVDSGVRKIEKAVQLAPNAPTIKLNLARAYIKAGRQDDARKLLDALAGEYPAGNPIHDEANAVLKTL